MSNVNQTYREVKRKANEGERIKIVKAEMVFGRYRNGDEFIADEITRLGVEIPEVSAECNSSGFISDREYIVLEPVVAPTPLAETAALNLPDLFAQFIRDNAGAVRSYLAELEPVDSAEVNDPAPPQLTRAKVIEMARERVAELERIGRVLGADLPKGTPFNDRFYNVEFHVNREKRKVTALVRYGNIRGGKPDAVGIAKAAPDDVFNEHIGKAVAAERALGLTLTEAFVNAPKPTEKVAGLSVNYCGCVRKLVPYNTTVIHGETAHVRSPVGVYGTIIDDTDAVYTESAAKDGEAA